MAISLDRFVFFYYHLQMFIVCFQNRLKVLHGSNWFCLLGRNFRLASHSVFKCYTCPRYFQQTWGNVSSRRYQTQKMFQNPEHKIWQEWHWFEWKKVHKPFLFTDYAKKISLWNINFDHSLQVLSVNVYQILVLKELWNWFWCHCIWNNSSNCPNDFTIYGRYYSIFCCHF